LYPGEISFRVSNPAGAVIFDRDGSTPLGGAIPFGTVIGGTPRGDGYTVEVAQAPYTGWVHALDLQQLGSAPPAPVLAPRTRVGDFPFGVLTPSPSRLGRWLGIGPKEEPGAPPQATPGQWLSKVAIIVGGGLAIFLIYKAMKATEPLHEKAGEAAARYFGARSGGSRMAALEGLQHFMSGGREAESAAAGPTFREHGFAPSVASRGPSPYQRVFHSEKAHVPAAYRTTAPQWRAPSIPRTWKVQSRPAPPMPEYEAYR
jgi:hypothetical protein